MRKVGKHPVIIMRRFSCRQAPTYFETEFPIESRLASVLSSTLFIGRLERELNIIIRGIKVSWGLIKKGESEDDRKALI